MRVADLDMTNSSHHCPSGLMERTDSNIHTCVQTNTECFSINYSTSNIQYSSVCGKIIAYQYGTTDAFSRRDIRHTTLSSNYVDGVSLTHGNFREHIWTFAADHDQNFPSCRRCGMSGVTIRPSFVGTDYFCDSGSYQFRCDKDILFC